MQSDTQDDLVSVPSVRRMTMSNSIPTVSTGYYQNDATPCNRALTFRRQTDSFDYFLCHKKHHSKLGGVPEQIAKNLHDALEILGYKGFFDTDDLEEISRESIAENLKKSRTLLVFMTDETVDSEWCRFEWETANSLDIPIKVVVDLAHFLKGDIVDQVKGGQYNFLLNYQWIEYTDSTRRMTVQYLAGWLGEESSMRKVYSRRPSREFMFDSRGALCVRDHGDTLKLFHPLFEHYMVASGLVYNIDAWSKPVQAWVPVVRCLSLACFGICLWRLIYATGPAYTDWFSCLYVVCIHLFLFHGVVWTTGLLSSDVMKTLLEHTASGDLAAWTARRVYKASWWAAIIGLFLGIAASISMIVIYLPLFLSSTYMSSASGMAFGISSAIFFTSVAPVVLVQEFAVLTLLYIIMELSYYDFEAAVCSLHELLPTVGLRQFVEAGSTQIKPTSAQLSKFSRHWSNAFALKLRLQRYINPVFYVHFVFNLMGLLIPCVYTFADRFYLELDLHWAQLAKPFMWWGYAACCYTGTVLLPAASCHGLEAVADLARCLNAGPKQKDFLLVSLQVDLSWRILPLKMTPLGGLLLMTPLLGSAVCWANIFCSLA